MFIIYKTSLIVLLSTFLFSSDFTNIPREKSEVRDSKTDEMFAAYNNKFGESMSNYEKCMSKVENDNIKQLKECNDKKRSDQMELKQMRIDNHNQMKLERQKNMYEASRQFLENNATGVNK